MSAASVLVRVAGQNIMLQLRLWWGQTVGILQLELEIRPSRLAGCGKVFCCAVQPTMFSILAGLASSFRRFYIAS